MFTINIYIVYFILIDIIGQIQTLVELPSVEDNYIAVAEKIIRNTVNNLFTAFKIQDVKHKYRLKQYSTIHNFFVSITLTDCDNLKEIARLARVSSIDNKTQHFITEVNEVLNEDDKSNEATDDNTYITIYINTFIRKLKYLKEIYNNYIKSKNNTVINTEILKFLDNDWKPLNNATEDSNISKSNDSDKNVLGDNEFWKLSDKSRRIYDGSRTGIKSFPFMARIQVFKKFQCAGSIIKNDLVITSSSCLQIAWNNRFFRGNPVFLSVQVGCDVFEGGGDNIAVLEIYFHPSYEPQTLRNNLAIMRLTRKIFFNAKHGRVKKINIDRSPWPLPGNTRRVIVVGWGARDSNNIVSNVNQLSYAELDPYPQDKCQEHFSEDFVTEKNFCAGFFAKGSGACNGDAGAPGIFKNTLIGVISFSSPICGAPDSPTVFTKLSSYTDWIDSIMGLSVPSVRQITTTLPSRTFYSLNSGSMTRDVKRVTPIKPISTLSHDPAYELDNLRIAPERDFKDFLATMFVSEELREYFSRDNSKFNEEMNDNQASNMQGKQRLVTRKQRTKKITRKLIQKLPKPTIVPITLAAEDYNGKEVPEKETTKKARQSKKEFQIIQNAGAHDKNLEEDITTLIDNLDIEKVLRLKKVSMSSEKISVIKENKNRTRKETVVASSGSVENLINLSPKLQSVLKLLFLSKKNDEEDDEGLSIQVG